METQKREETFNYGALTLRLLIRVNRIRDGANVVAARSVGCFASFAGHEVVRNAPRRK